MLSFRFLSICIIISGLSYAQTPKAQLTPDSSGFYWNIYIQDTLKNLQFKYDFLRVAKKRFGNELNNCKQYESNISKCDSCLKGLLKRLTKTQNLFLQTKDKTELKKFRSKLGRYDEYSDQWKFDAAEKWLFLAQQKLIAKKYFEAYEFAQNAILHCEDYEYDPRITELLKQCISKHKITVGILPILISYEKTAKEIQILTSNYLAKFSDTFFEVYDPQFINKRTFELTNLDDFSIANFFNINYLIVLKPKLIVSDVKMDTLRKTAFKINLNNKFYSFDTTHFLECSSSLKTKYVFEYRILNAYDKSILTTDSVSCMYIQNSSEILTQYKISELSNVEFKNPANLKIPDKVLAWQKQMSKIGEGKMNLYTVELVHQHMNECISNKLTKKLVNILVN